MARRKTPQISSCQTCFGRTTCGIAFRSCTETAVDQKWRGAWVFRSHLVQTTKAG